MINRIIDFSANNKLIVFLLVAAAAIMGWWSMKNVPLDAIPDLSETQVIIYSRWDRSPDILEDQVTYPIVTAMLGAPGVRTVRGFSDFGYSFVYVIFDGGNRHLLGPFADPGVPVGGPAAAPPGGPDGAGTRCHGTRAGCSSTCWSIRPDSRAWRNSAPTRTGTCATTSSRCRGWPKWPPSVVSASSTRSISTPTGCSSTTSPSAGWWRRSGGAITTQAGGSSSSAGPSTWSAAGGMPARSRISGTSPCR